MDSLLCFDSSTPMVSTGNRHLKYPCMKLPCGIRMQAIWKIIYIAIYSFLFALPYIVSCVLFCSGSSVLEAKMNHVIPCLSIKWKSSGSFFIMHLILILSLSLIMNFLCKLILLSLKVTMTSFQSISKVSQI